MLLCVHSSIEKCSVLQPGTTFTCVSLVTQSRARCLVPEWTQQVSAYLSLFAGGFLGLLCNYRTEESWKITQCSFLIYILPSSLSVFVFCFSLLCNGDSLSSMSDLLFYQWSTWEWKWSCPTYPCEGQNSKITPDGWSSCTNPSPWVLVGPLGWDAPNH